ncbi:MAG: ABC transporter ATP-binding protein [Tissierellia bacterium]|nr:ABC transporter ATP-binding protein [Tissierellia bacterium]
MSEKNRRFRRNTRSNMAAPVENAKDFKGSFKKLIGYLGTHKWTILFVWILAIISTVFTIVGPKVLAKATDELVRGFLAKISGTGTIDFTKIGKILAFMMGLYFISATFTYLQGFVMAGVTSKVTKKMRNDIDIKIHKLPLEFFDKHSTGDILSRITNDVDMISRTLNQSMTQIVTSVTSLIGIAIMMFSISWKLSLAALSILPISMLIIYLIVSKSQKYFVAQQESLGDLNGHIEEMLGNHILIKAFNGEKNSIETFAKYNEELFESSWKATFLSSLMMPILNIVANLGYVAICVLGGAYVVAGTLTIGGIQAFIQYMRQFNQPISQVTQISNVLQQTAAAAERVFEFLAEEEETADEVQTNDAIKVSENEKDMKGEIEFKHVKFGYDSQKPVIKDFNAKVKAGQKIAIVGPTGAGKTTIVKLLMRFYDVDEGEILIDNRNIKSLSRKSLRDYFGMVLQDTWLFSGTIKENIRYGRLDATDEEVYEAAKAAQIDHFINTLPKTYDMVLNEEADNISQGQKQLLTIARAIIADPKILILDEATSSVDTRTELLIQKAMDNLMAGRTSFIIAHRLSTIKDADMILVMKDGDIIEQGNHDELLAKKGFYSELYNSQFELATA